MSAILVVDDDHANLFLMEQLLERHGLVNETLSDPLLVLDRARALKPALILLDVMMPVKDGIAVLRDLKADVELEQIPVIMVTARGDSEMLARALDAGAADYVRKPVDTTELMARINGVLKLKQYADELRKLDQLKVVREMVGTVCHNFNQPLTAMRAYLSLLEKRLSDGDCHCDAVDLTQKLNETMNELVDLIDRLRKVSRYKPIPYADGVTIVDIEKPDTRDLDED